MIFEKLFASYRDPNDLFAMVYPRAWKIRRSNSWNPQGTVHYTETVFGPSNEYSVQMNSDLLEGIKVTIATPRDGLIFTQSIDEYASDFVKQRILSQPGLVLVNSSTFNFAGQIAKMFEFVAGAMERETRTCLVVATKDYCFVVELITSTGVSKTYGNSIFSRLWQPVFWKSLRLSIQFVAS